MTRPETMTKSPPTLTTSGTRMVFVRAGAEVEVITHKLSRWQSHGGGIVRRRKSIWVVSRRRTLDLAHARNLWRKLLADGWTVAS